MCTCTFPKAEQSCRQNRRFIDDQHISWQKVIFYIRKNLMFKLPLFGDDHQPRMIPLR